MAVYLNNLATVSIGGTDISDMVQSITLNRTFEEVDITAMGDTSRRMAAGLEASTVTIDFLNDTTDSPTINAYAGTSKSLVIAQNGKTYTGNVLVNNMTPVNGAVGDMSTQSVTWNYVGPITVS